MYLASRRPVLRSVSSSFATLENLEGNPSRESVVHSGGYFSRQIMKPSGAGALSLRVQRTLWGSVTLKVEERAFEGRSCVPGSSFARARTVCYPETPGPLEL